MCELVQHDYFLSFHAKFDYQDIFPKYAGWMHTSYWSCDHPRCSLTLLSYCGTWVPDWSLTIHCTLHTWQPRHPHASYELWACGVCKSRAPEVCRYIYLIPLWPRLGTPEEHHISIATRPPTLAKSLTDLLSELIVCPTLPPTTAFGRAKLSLTALQVWNPTNWATSLPYPGCVMTTMGDLNNQHIILFPLYNCKRASPFQTISWDLN